MTNLKFCQLVTFYCSFQVQQHPQGLPGFHQTFYHFMFFQRTCQIQKDPDSVKGKASCCLSGRNRSQMFNQICNFMKTRGMHAQNPDTCSGLAMKLDSAACASSKWLGTINVSFILSLLLPSPS